MRSAHCFAGKPLATRRWRMVGLGLAAVTTFVAWPLEAGQRWTAATTEETVALALDTAQQRGADALARLVLAHALSQDATAGRVRSALDAIGAGDSPLAREAHWLARLEEPESRPAPWAGVAAAQTEDDVADADGLVRSFAVLGPFEDAGGGLVRREGPERAGHDYTAADESWGVFQVRYRRSLPSSVTARGLPLDLYVQPRKESCTYLASVVDVAASPQVVLRIAAAGAFRVAWDSVDIARDDEIHPRMLLDRAAVLLEAGSGEHSLVVKVCSGALPDSGRIRLRFTDPAGAPLAVRSTSDLERLQARSTMGAPTVQATRVATPLEEAIETGDEPTNDQALAAALVRTLAGAEDVRHARAPGLLDRVVASAELTADELALAATVSQFAANRSGWLNLALERALDAGDAATASYCLRALTRSRLGAQLPDLAQATLEREPLASARDVEVRLLRARAAASMGVSGLREQALLALTAITKETPDAPVAVWRGLAQLADRSDPMLALAARKRLAELAPDALDRSFVSAFEPLGGARLEDVAMRALPLQTDARQVVSIAGALLDAGRYAAAERAFEFATFVAPNLADAFRGLGRSAAIVGAPGADERTLLALERARALQPSDAKLAAEIEFRQAARGGSAGAPPADEAYLEPAAVFLARAKGHPADPVVVVERELHWRRVVTYHADKRVSQLMHYAREIVMEPRTEDERYERFPARGANTELVLARLHRTDGSIVGPQEQDSSGPRVLWPQLHRGDVVEVAVRVWTPGPVGRRGDAPFHFVDYVGSTEDRPVLYNDVVIDAPLDQPLSFDVLGGVPDERLESDSGGRHVTRLVWNAPPVIRDEPFAPPSSELMPTVVGSAFPGWDSFLDWYRGATAGFTEPDAQVRRLAQELTTDAKTRDQKVEKLFDFVADDIRYVNYRSGEWWLPNRPQQLLARRQGDCDDKAMLLITLLGAVGIDASEVLIQTRYTSQPTVLRSRRVAIPLFDHGIIFLHGEGGKPGRYLDATSPESRIGSVPSMDSGAMALFVAGGGPDGPGPVQPIDTPPATAAEHASDAHYTLEVAASGAGQIRAREHHTGDLAFFLRNALQQPDARAQWVERNLVGGWFPAVSVAPEVTFDGELPGGAADVSYHAKSDALARREGEDLLVALAPAMPYTARLAPLTERTLPVLLPVHLAPRRAAAEIVVRVPEGYRVAALPPDSPETQTPFGTTQLSFDLAPGGTSVTIRRVVSFEKARIEVAEYKAWRTWLQGIDRLLQRGVRLVRQAR